MERAVTLRDIFNSVNKYLAVKFEVRVEGPLKLTSMNSLSNAGKARIDHAGHVEHIPLVGYLT